jgi:hypothetical protein
VLIAAKVGWGRPRKRCGPTFAGRAVQDLSARLRRRFLAVCFEPRINQRNLRIDRR